MKQKIKIFINPLRTTSTNPIDLVLVSDALDYLSGRFDIDSIDIQLNDTSRPSEFYFDMLSGLSKSSAKKVHIDDYIGNKKPNVFRLDSFESLNIIMDNEKIFTVIWQNQTSHYQDLPTLIDFLSQY